MVAELHRAKLRDLAISALILLGFALVPFIFTVAKHEKFSSTPLRLVQDICLGVSIPLFLLGATPLMYYWRKGRDSDDPMLSNPTPAQLKTILIAAVSIACGCLLLICGNVVTLVGYIQKHPWRWVFTFEILALIMLIATMICVIQITLQVRALRKQINSTMPPTNPQPHTKDTRQFAAM